MLPDLIGRDTAIHDLRDVVVRGAETLSIGMVEGAAGLGKTALVDHVLDSVDGERVLAGGGHAHLARAPLALVSELTGRTDLIDPDGGADVDLGATVVRAVGVLLDRIAELTRDRAGVLVVDDLHWVDRASIQALDLAIGRCAHEPLAIVLATRPVPDDRDDLAALVARLRSHGAATLELEPLEHDAARRLVEAVAPGATDDGIEACVVSGAGNPVVLRHLASGLAEGTPPSTSLVPVARQRLAGLSEAAAAAVRVAAIGGRDVDTAALARLVDTTEAEVSAWMHQAVTAGLVEPVGTTWRFGHDLLLDAVVDTISEAERTSLHRRWASCLDGHGTLQVQAAADHLLAAGAPLSASELDTLTTAARQVLLTSPDRAAQLFAHVIDSTAEGDPARDVALTGLAEANLWAEHPDQHGAGRAGAVDALTRLQQEHSRGRVSRATLLDAEQHARRELTGDTLDEALARIAKYAASALQPVPHLITELEARAETLSPVAEVWLRSAQDRLNTLRGEFLETFWVGERARQAAASLPDEHPARIEAAIVYGRLACQTQGGELEAGFESLAWAERQAERIGSQRLQMEVSLDLGLMSFLWHRWDEAQARFAAGAALARDTKAATTRAHFEWRELQLAVLRGEFDTADQLLDAHAGSPDPAGLWAMEIGLLKLLRGDATGAIETLAPLATGRDTFPEIRRNVLQHLVCAGHDAGDATAFQVAREGAGLMPGDAKPIQLVRTLVVAAVEADGELATRAFSEVEGAPPYVEAGFSLLIGIAFGRAGDADQAVSWFRRSRELSTDVEAMGRVMLTDRWLTALGATPDRPARARPTTGWASLTPAELRVAEVVAEGLVYREVAERLFISRRTVESHVASALRKLGLQNRSQLATSYLTREPVDA